MAIAPANTVGHHALLLINPHTSFFFRSELQMVSEQGLNAYGAVTWGQFFIYQGFNERAGWMHTSSGVDAVDEYLETVEKKGDAYFYKYGNEQRPVTATKITVPYKTRSGHGGKERSRSIRTHHGPVVREAGGKWVSIRLMQENIKALEQSYTRTKARDYKSYRQTMELKANSSNNTIFADADGDIAYFHGNYIPRRDTSFDWTKPVDGSNPATEWKGLLAIDETPHLLNPANGWLYNTNNWPWSAAGPNSPKKEDYPVYVESGGESARGLHAIRVLQNKQDFTLDSLMAAAYRQLSYVVRETDSGFGESLGRCRRDQPFEGEGGGADWIAARVGSALGRRVRADLAGSVLGRGSCGGAQADRSRATPDQCFNPWRRRAISSRRTSERGRPPWGDINRFQRITGDIVQPFNDAAAEHPGAVSPRRCGARWLRSVRGRIPGPKSGTGPAVTALSLWWSSATRCGPGR